MGWLARTWPRAPTRQDDLLAYVDRQRPHNQRLGEQGPEQNAYTTLGEGGYWARSSTCCNGGAWTRTVQLATDIEPRRSSHRDWLYPWAGRLYGSNKSQSVNVGTTCTKIIYDKNLHGENLAKMGLPDGLPGQALWGADSSTISFGSVATRAWLPAGISTLLRWGDAQGYNC